MQERGTFGWKGPLRSEFGGEGSYPLATLALDEGVLEAKWAATHFRSNE